MPSTPFLVLDRSTRKVLHQSQSLDGARGFSEARDEPTTVAMVAEMWAATEWRFVFQIVDGDTGRVLMTSEAMDFDDACELMYSLKVMLVPECVARKAVTP